MVAPRGTNNYEVAEVELLPNGEIVTAANGTAVFICRPGGDKIARVTLTGHYISHPTGVHQVGQVFEYLGISFVVEQLLLSGQARIEGTVPDALGSLEFDGRAYTMVARSVTPVTETQIAELKAGEGP